LLAAFCPFTSNYVAAPLAETLAIFCTAHAFYYGVRGIKSLRSSQRALMMWALAGFWTALSILLRPDDGLLLPAFGLALLLLLFLRVNWKQIIAAGAVFLIVSLAPLVPWTVRNWRVFHVFQPLASRYATDPGEFVPYGFNHWVKTWMADYASVEDIFWQVNGDPIDLQMLPGRAFDSRREYDHTRELIDRYNQQLYMDPQLDWQFELLARERVVHNPFRYFVGMPFLRISDMWLRPRTEILPVDTHWWNFEDGPGESVFVLFWAALNLFYLIAALRGWISWRLGLLAVPLIAYLLLRSIFLSTIENPEPRYVLECFPVVLTFAGGAFARPKAVEPTPVQ
jgi:hypothetical protein